MKKSRMGIHPQWLPSVMVGLMALGALLVVGWWGRDLPGPKRGLLYVALGFAACLVLGGMAVSPIRVAALFPRGIVVWVRAAAVVAAAWALAALVLTAAWRRVAIERFDPGRRALLRAARNATYLAPAAVTGFAIVKRHELRLVERDVPIRGLHKDLDGLRLAQISDIHLSDFVPARELARAVAMANETRPHIALVTGDLISFKGDPLDTCLDELSRLRPEAGVFGCMGNHEVYAETESYTYRHGARRGIQFLRNESRQLRFGSADINLSGVDYQQRGKPYLVNTARLLQPGMPNILLSHNPDVFPVAARIGYDLTLSGHTHGGQVNFELLHQHLNVVRFLTPYIYGLYEQAGSAIYVTRGVGTIGVPARLGAPPEVALIRLCAT